MAMSTTSLGVSVVPTLQDSDADRSAARSNSSSRRAKMRSENDFIFGKLIGQGSFSSVYLVKDTHNQQEYAAKVCQKTLLLKEKKTTHVMREKEIMNLLNLRENSTAPFFVKLAYSFQTEANLYFILSYCKNGEFLELIQHVGNFDHDSARFYTGEIVRGLEHLHSLNIVHRDLKPENILLDEKMHIKISDFGSAKIVEEPEEDSEAQLSGTLRSSSFVGTAQYVSPEVLHSKQVCLASDLWSLGCIIYQIVSGLPPFRSQSEYLIFKSILSLQYEYPQGFFEDAKDMVQKLLVRETMKRLGATDRGGCYDSLRQHPFLAPLDLDTLYATTPPTITTYTPDAGEDVWDSSLTPGLEERELELLHQMIISPRLPPAQQLQQQQQQQQQSVNSNSSPTASFTGSSSKVASPAHSRTSESGACRGRRNLADITMEEHERRLRVQERESEWHQYVDGNLILKQGFLYKRKGLFPRRRMFLLTTGPHLYYVDPDNHVLKGQVPYGPTLRPEGKTFKTFLVHTPNRTYYLEDPENASAQWMTALEDVRDYYFPDERDGDQ